MPTEKINELEPFEKLNGIAVLGIKQGKIYVTDKKYKVYEKWDQVELWKWDDVMSKTLPHSKPKWMIDYMDVPYK